MWQRRRRFDNTTFRLCVYVFWTIYNDNKQWKKKYIFLTKLHIYVEFKMKRFLCGGVVFKVSIFLKTKKNVNNIKTTKIRTKLHKAF